MVSQGRFCCNIGVKYRNAQHVRKIDLPLIKYVILGKKLSDIIQYTVEPAWFKDHPIRKPYFADSQWAIFPVNEPEYKGRGWSFRNYLNLPVSFDLS